MEAKNEMRKMRNERDCEISSENIILLRLCEIWGFGGYGAYFLSTDLIRYRLATSVGDCSYVV